MSAGRRTEASTMPLTIDKGEPDGRDFLDVSLLRKRDARSTTVQLSRSEGPEFSMTLEEAIALAKALSLLVSDAVGAQTGETA